MISSLIRAFNALIDKWALFNVSTATYDSLSKSVAAQDTLLAGLTFSPDGTKMFIIGTINDTVYQYTLSTAWNVSTATYASLSKSVAAQDTIPSGLTFSPDGTKMFVLGGATDTVYQYTLSTAWNVSTATYASLSKYINAQDTILAGLAFSPDGTKMFTTGTTYDSVFQYTLSTAWNVSTATYASSKYVGEQEASPNNVDVSPDGTKMFIVGANNNTVYQYTLSTAWNVSTATYDSLSKSVAAQDTILKDCAFSPDGTKMYLLGITNKTVYQYTT